MTVKLVGHTQWDYDLNVLKPILKEEGKEVAKAARRLVSRAGRSSPGQYPGKQSGVLSKTIKSKISRVGLSVVVTHTKLPGARYPFMLAYGTLTIAPRKDYMLAAINSRLGQITNGLNKSLVKVITPK